MAAPALQELISRMKSPTVAELAMVGKTFDFAQKAHEGHRRYSGEPYLTHLVETAKILAELGMESRSLNWRTNGGIASFPSVFVFSEVLFLASFERQNKRDS